MEDYTINNSLLNNTEFVNKDFENCVKVFKTLMVKRNDYNFELLKVLQNMKYIVSGKTGRADLSTAFIDMRRPGFGNCFTSFYRFFKDYFNISEKTVRNYLQVANKFLVELECPAGGNLCLKYDFKYKFSLCSLYTISKLQELVILSDKQLEEAFNYKHLTAHSTKAEIRAYVKSLKDGIGKAEKVLESTTSEAEEEIELAYNPKQKYEFSYYESKSKGQLLNIIKDLLKYIDTLKDEKKTKKVGK